MKNFSELLDTKQEIKIIVRYDGKTVEQTVDLLDPINILIRSDQDIEIESLEIDGFELVPKYNHLLPNSSSFVAKGIDWQFSIDIPFYQWKHQATHQGWLFYQNTKK